MNVTLDASAIWGGAGPLLHRLIEELGEATHPRLIFLPPLVANLVACDESTRGRTLREAVSQTARSRLARRFAVRFAYPGSSPGRRPWLVQHDLVHRVLRGPLANLAQASGASLVAGTAILDHPRTHWEDWPDTGHLFHTAWCFSEDAEPHDVLRHRVPGWRVFADCDVDPSLTEERVALRTPLGGVSILWNDTTYGSPPAGPVVWAPRIWSTAEARDESCPAASPATLLGGGALVAVRTCLVGQLGSGIEGESFIASRREDGVIASQVAPWPTDGLSWCRALLPWPWPASAQDA